MVGPSVGLVSAVYNYDRRSAAINDIFEEIFSMVAFNFYNDKYRFETAETAPSAKEVAQGSHHILGAQFEEKKLQLSSSPVILGVTYNLDEMVLEIKKSRKEELTDTTACRARWARARRASSRASSCLGQATIMGESRPSLLQAFF